MKQTLLSTILAASLSLMAPVMQAQTTNAAPPELQELFRLVNNRLQQLPTREDVTEQAFSEVLKSFDAAFAKHQGDKTELPAQILLAKANLYMDLLKDPEKGTAALRQIKTNFPGTKPAAVATEKLAVLDREEQDFKARSALVLGAKCPDFKETDLLGKPLSLAAYRGKVVLIQFWASTSLSCAIDTPAVMEAYGKNHTNGLEIIGVSLDESRQKAQDFVKQHNIPWQQYFDGKGKDNKLAVQFGVGSVPFSLLLDREGRVFAKGLRGDGLKNKVAELLALDRTENATLAH